MYSAIHDFPHIAACRLSNDFIRSRQHIRRDRQADLLRRLEVDDQLELCRLLDWQVRGLCAFQDLVDKNSSAPERVDIVWAIGHKPPSLYAFTLSKHCWQAVLCREFCDLLVIGTTGDDG